MSSAGFMQSFQTANSRRTFILSNWDKFKKNVWLFERCWVISTYFHYQLEIASVYSVYYTKKKKIEQLKILRQICFDSPAMQSDEGLLPRKPPPQSRCALCDDTLWNCNHYWNHLIWTQLVVPIKHPSDRSGQICALFSPFCWVLFFPVVLKWFGFQFGSNILYYKHPKTQKWALCFDWHCVSLRSPPDSNISCGYNQGHAPQTGQSPTSINEKQLEFKSNFLYC